MIILAAVIILIQFLILTHLQFTAWPEMFSYPYLINKGFTIYKDIGFPYQPLFSLILAFVYQVFGYQLEVIKLIAWLMILVSDILIFLISIKILGKNLKALLPLVFFCLLQPLMDGATLWFDLATVPFILLGIYLFLTLIGLKRFFWLGFFLSLACLIKQQVAVVFPLILIYLLVTKKFKDSPMLLIGSLIPVLAVTFYIISKGILTDYIFWTITVPLVWYPKFPGYTHFPSRLEIAETILIFGPGIFWSILNWKKIDFKIIFLIFLALFITAFPRFEFFRFQEALALYVILLAYLLQLKIGKCSLIIGASLAIFLLAVRTDFTNLSARFYGPEEISFSQRIGNLAKPSDRIFLLNSDSLKYVLSNRLPPKPWIDNYIWYMEIPGIQDKVVAGFAKEKPKYIFRKTPQTGNWFDQGTYEPKKIIEYVKLNYRPVDKIGEVEVWQIN